MIKIICNNEVINKKSKEGSRDIELVLKGNPCVLSSQLASALKEIYDANADVMIHAIDILINMVDEDCKKMAKELDDYE